MERPNTQGNWDYKTLNYVEEIEQQNKGLIERGKTLKSLFDDMAKKYENEIDQNNELNKRFDTYRNISIEDFNDIQSVLRNVQAQNKELREWNTQGTIIFVLSIIGMLIFYALADFINF